MLGLLSLIINNINSHNNNSHIFNNNNNHTFNNNNNHTFNNNNHTTRRASWVQSPW